MPDVSTALDNPGAKELPGKNRFRVLLQETIPTGRYDANNLIRLY
ncbi:hypothetical protein PGH42_00005 [Legionella pneumophila]|nr:hypothetical protein PGH42_00005 [Legionella pneumophila]